MKTYKRHKVKEDSPLHDQYCDCYDCYSPWDNDEDEWDDWCDCDGCQDWWRDEKCHRDVDDIYEKRKRREDIINSLLDEDIIRHPELEELYKKMRNDEQE